MLLFKAYWLFLLIIYRSNANVGKFFKVVNR